MHGTLKIMISVVFQTHSLAYTSWDPLRAFCPPSLGLGEVHISLIFLICKQIEKSSLLYKKHKSLATRVYSREMFHVKHKSGEHVGANACGARRCWYIDCLKTCSFANYARNLENLNIRRVSDSFSRIYHLRLAPCFLPSEPRSRSGTYKPDFSNLQANWKI